ncbi:hypothetical protein CDV36_014254 [Fusarium kuroshium]|uniref:Protein kinase domain-containing protein n=1 Tax=Fusarium kuroshium TaxID=2010991 RepID=A0A3M2RID8_9HYPO|nr:hypothetical protein CDV36_014254 [Fusarium kuroshium]
MEFCGAIDFSALPLLDDTVTELFISASRNDTATRLVHSPFPDDHPFATKSGRVWVNIQEDPARVRYPSYIGTSARQIDISEVDTLEQISPAVYTARIESEGKQTYILKQVERLLYLPQDSQALKKELQVLEEAGGQGNIVRLIAAVVSRNPYGTTITSGQEAPRVLRGILLEQHPGGTLAEALETANVGAYLQRWGAQLCTAVAALHQHNVTHMDIKPSNMVLDKDKNLVLIDVGGAGGVTREWLSPKMQQILDPLSTNLQDRKENDTWAVGKVLCRMAEVREQTDEQQQHLRSVADKAMGDPRQASLSDIAADLTARTDLRVKTQSSRHSMT